MALNRAAAEEHFAIACKAEIASACHELAALEEAAGDKPALKRSRVHFKQACKLGHVEACARVGGRARPLPTPAR